MSKETYYSVKRDQLTSKRDLLTLTNDHDVNLRTHSTNREHILLTLTNDHDVNLRTHSTNREHILLTLTNGHDVNLRTHSTNREHILLTRVTWDLKKQKRPTDTDKRDVLTGGRWIMGS